MKEYEENLSIIMEGVLNDLPPVVDKKIKWLKNLEKIKSENYVVSLLSQILKSTIQIHLMNLDICAEYRLVLHGQTVYEKRFGAKHLRATLNECYKRLYGFNNNRNPKLDSELDIIINSLNDVDKNYYEKELNEIISNLKTFEDEIIFDKNGRSLVYHYSKNIMHTYSFLESLDVEKITNSAIKLFNIINAISNLLDKIISDMNRKLLNQLGLISPFENLN